MKKIIAILFKSVFYLFIAWGAVVYATIKFFGHDIEAFDDSKIKLVMANDFHENDPWKRLYELGEKYQPVATEKGTGLQAKKPAYGYWDNWDTDRIVSMRKGSIDWDDKFVEKTLEDHIEGLLWLRHAYEWDWSASGKSIDMSIDNTEFTWWLINVALLNMEYTYRKDGLSASLSLWIDYWQISQKMKTNGTEVQYLTLLNFDEELEYWFLDVILKEQLSETQLLDVKAILDEDVEKQALIHALKSDYVLFEDLLESADMYSRMPAKQQPGLNRIFAPIGIDWRSYLYQKNKTKQYYADFFELAVEQPLPYEAFKKKYNAESVHLKKDSWCFYLKSNAIGKMMFNMMDTFNIVVSNYARSLEYMRLTQTVIACERYRLGYGKLPERLEDLVPAFLDAVPSDTFDGKSMRYNPENKIIYSVDSDFKDDGGDENHDIVVKLRN